MHLAGIQPVDAAAEAQLRKLLAAHVAGPRWCQRLCGQGSWNVPVIDGATQLWAGHPAARGDWLRFLR